MRAPADARLVRLRGREEESGSRSPIVAGRRAEELDAARPPGGLGLIFAVCLALGALSLFFYATPTYDPWAWILWGREVAHLDLVTEGGPSWKPLPVVFTTVFSLFGEDVAPALWLAVARAGALLACVMAFRVAWRLAGGGLAGALGGAASGLLLLASFNFVRDAALGNSEALMVALVLLAFERHLDGQGLAGTSFGRSRAGAPTRQRAHALYFGVAAALLRPEIWPFLGIYGLFLLVREPALRVRTALLGLLVPLLWFGPELWGSGQALRAATRATNPNRGSAALAEDPTMLLLERFGGSLGTPVKIGAAVAVAWALYRFLRRRSDRPVLALFAGGCAWFALVAVMTEAGYAGNSRYLIVSLTAITVLAGVGAAFALRGAGAVAERLTGRPWAARAVIVAGAAVAVCLVALPVMGQKGDSFVEKRFVKSRKLVAHEASLWPNLERVIAAAGGKERLKACGGLYSGPYQTQMVAYELGVHGAQVRSLEGTPPPGAGFRTRTIPTGPLVIELTDRRYRQIAREGKWRVVTVPPGGRSACPAASRDAPRSPAGGRATIR
ncbi:MAG: hypothetical protein M3350_05845 [Actinomycetota bacterium]|nr:hypothetical protein [Actinomycetota bacterium]MDQ3720288.1 hypothetical protein [Actinomycetota bacterium]